MSPMPSLPTTVPLLIINKDGEHSDSSYGEHPSKKQKNCSSSPLMEMISLSYLMGRGMIPLGFVLLTLHSKMDASGRRGATFYIFLSIRSGWSI